MYIVDIDVKQETMWVKWKWSDATLRYRFAIAYQDPNFPCKKQITSRHNMVVMAVGKSFSKEEWKTSSISEYNALI